MIIKGREPMKKWISVFLFSVLVLSITPTHLSHGVNPPRDGIVRPSADIPPGGGEG